MKKITMMPDTVVPNGRRDMRTGEMEDLPYDMKKWFRLIMGGNEKFGKGSEGIALNVKISDKIEKARRELLLEDEEYRELSKGKENTPLGSDLGRACYPYFEAFDNAVDVEIQKTSKKK